MIAIACPTSGRIFHVHLLRRLNETPYAVPRAASTGNGEEDENEEVVSVREHRLEGLVL